jgi:hypothetical protein
LVYLEDVFVSLGWIRRRLRMSSESHGAQTSSVFSVPLLVRDEGRVQRVEDVAAFQLSQFTHYDINQIAWLRR